MPLALIFHSLPALWTGLGPEGVDTLVLEDRKLAHIAAKYFPEESTGRGGLKDYNRGGEAALSGYDFTIGTSSVSTGNHDRKLEVSRPIHPVIF